MAATFEPSYNVAPTDTIPIRIRIRTGRLPVLGPFDVEASGVTGLMFDALVDRLREVRGALIVDCYLLR